MPDDKESLSKKLSSLLEKTAVRAKMMETVEIISTYERIEASFISKVSGQVDLVLETRRRVAEWKFDLLVERGISWDELQKLHASIRDLGYVDLEREATREIIYARACIRHDRDKEATTVLRKLLNKLHTRLRKKSEPVFNELKNTAERLIKNLHK